MVACSFAAGLCKGHIPPSMLILKKGLSSRGSLVNGKFDSPGMSSINGFE